MTRRAFAPGIAFFGLLFAVPAPLYADKKDHEGEKGQSKTFGTILDKTYRQECGACHMPYHPGLMPMKSWERLLSALPKHFSEEVVIDNAVLGSIRKYLIENASENSHSERAKKILKSIKGEAPTRISEMPYILEKHHDIDPGIFTRKSVGSRSNCAACHRSVDQGNYDDDNVVIPK